jgi:DNA-binding GntR family transcriptional regulator
MEAVAEHEALIEAIRARDPDKAERIARDHMHRAQQLRVKMIQTAATGSRADSSTAKSGVLRSVPAVG